ncbi:hypothetical protein QNI19_27300 [Cytophagaceae bacterium DM2B3-1]|uniref:Uncharacterized protein n=1 Tax=Xanthocytophaga flava TaxID=3048013 RepID=A0ABT7CUQ8_9BACT|nr:hypothetical protein [Xanthocytophaga flavus]MDJ1471481.1 hypothetical protein [Xanthocytophaga flavus]MDJ1496670.1 hypothetical protein [Xanthocytophaga flavus]
MKNTRLIYSSLIIALIGGIILWRNFRLEKCTGIADGLTTIFLWILSLLLVSLILPGAFQRYKEQKDPVELLPIGMVVFLCGCYMILSLLRLSTDKAFMYAETYYGSSLALWNNGTYLLEQKATDWGCSYSGSYLLQRDTLILEDVRQTIDSIFYRKYIIRKPYLIPMLMKGFQRILSSI